MNLPGTNILLPILQEKDEDDLINFGLKEGVDLIAASFVRSREDIETIRDVLGPRGAKIKIIAKIENHQGIENFEGILEEADGIMVARGDLGMEIPVEKVFVAQKFMIERANIAGKPIITATQMLDSMIKNPRPTRAEATDVANAVLDGTDCVMLSGETAGGLYPIEACTTMAKLCVEAEQVINYEYVFSVMCKNTKKPYSTQEACCASAVKTAEDIDASLLVVITENGLTARLLSKYRPPQHILALW
jgi:pyruvate kinase